jgi:curved DNA-binding protein CbpA
VRSPANDPEVPAGRLFVLLTHYDVLGVEPTAELETIRRAWRLRVRLLHPDRYQDAPSDVRAEATRETLRVNEAWETLRDSYKRHEYDAYLSGRGKIDVEREQTERASDARSGPPAREARREFLSPYMYLNLVSLLIVVVAIAFLVVGAALLARLA